MDPGGIGTAPGAARLREADDDILNVGKVGGSRCRRDACTALSRNSRYTLSLNVRLIERLSDSHVRQSSNRQSPKHPIVRLRVRTTSGAAAQKTLRDRFAGFAAQVAEVVESSRGGSDEGAAMESWRGRETEEQTRSRWLVMRKCNSPARGR